MAKQLGRKVIIKVGGVAIAAARTKTLTISNEPVNVTTDGDDGIQTLLTEAGEKAVTVSVEDVGDQTALVDIALGSDLIQAIELDYGTFSITGDFFQASYEEGLPYNDAITFTAEYQSSGAVLRGTGS
jgi:predicted secreted protein